MTEKTKGISGFVGMISVLILSSAVGWIGPWPINKFLYAFLGGVAFFFMPGFLLSFIVFPRARMIKKKVQLKKQLSLNLLERMILGLLFSLAIVAIVFTILRWLDIILTPEIIGWMAYSIISILMLVLVRFRFYWKF